MTSTSPQPADERPADERPTVEQPTVERAATPGATGAAAAATPPGSPHVEETRASGGPRVRVGTVVWGLVIAAVGVGVLALASGYVFDVELAFIGLVTLAGVALLAGSLINGARHRGR